MPAGTDILSAGGGAAADWDHSGHRAGRRALVGPVAVAVLGGAWSGPDHRGPGGVRGPGRRLPVGPGCAAAL